MGHSTHWVFGKFDDRGLKSQSGNHPTLRSFRAPMSAFRPLYGPVHQSAVSLVGTKRHCVGWLISCPESREVRTPIKGHRNLVRRRYLTRRGLCRHGNDHFRPRLASDWAKAGLSHSLVRLRGLLIDLPRRGLPFLQRSGSLSRQRPAPVELEQFGGKVEQRGPREGDHPYPLHHTSLVTALWCTLKSFAID